METSTWYVTYTEHATADIGKENTEINAFIYETFASTLDVTLSADDLVALTLKTGRYGVKAMALLDEANTSKYGNPEITSVNIGVRNNPAILISGHDLTDLERLLEQTKGTGVDVYTHSEMLPAHYYHHFIVENFVGNYGNHGGNSLRNLKLSGTYSLNCIYFQK